MSSAYQFRKLHDNLAPLRLPNAWDVASARLFESLGAAAIATTSAGMAWSLGYRDGRGIPATEVIGAAVRMARVVSVPLSIDLENGYSGNPRKVADTVARLAGLGVAGINIEDGHDEPEVLARKIQEIRGAVARAGTDIFVNARCDVFLSRLVDESRFVEEAIARGKLYANAGADGLFLPAISQPEQIEAVVRGVSIPLNVMAVPGLADAEELGRLGVRRLSAGSGISQAVWKHAGSLVQEFLQTGRSRAVTSELMGYGQLQGLFPEY